MSSDTEQLRPAAAGSAADERMRRLAEEPLESAGPAHGFLKGTLKSVRDLAAYRELLVLLVRRELKARYKDSTLGFLWSLIRPLTILLVYYVAIGKFLGAERSIPEFAIYIFTGLIAWQFFAEVVSAGTGSIVNNGGLIKKVYLPREVFPLSVVGSALFTLATQFIVLIVALIVTGSIPTGSRLLFVPLALAVLLVYATAFALVLSAVNVYLRDVAYLVEISLTVLFWLSPVVYSWELVRSAIDDGFLQNLYLANPVTSAVLAMQRGLWVAGTDQPFPDALGARLLVMLGIGVVLLWLAQRAFARLEANFAQEI
ncbi:MULTISPECIES: ABC transporter permease [unclassified Modestobacter]|uniref:ABC transporter permease n=1 Tax=unclassified Modestobacter TaxID=2643866 RepID=UPI0022AB235F|nr:MULTISPECIES: ABC transporter permease [unclassified Modestobacter]MCZ2823772.1 ABC transporter permease [Modestobacter sp. VKM Ac-2981]MCZ2852017.1 ABC transporter permease [Modestobacter sp. VKM Ac-2982]